MEEKNNYWGFFFPPSKNTSSVCSTLGVKLPQQRRWRDRHSSVILRAVSGSSMHGGITDRQREALKDKMAEPLWGQTDTSCWKSRFNVKPSTYTITAFLTITTCKNWSTLWIPAIKLAVCSRSRHLMWDGLWHSLFSTLIYKVHNPTRTFILTLTDENHCNWNRHRII